MPDQQPQSPLVEGVDYYLEGGYVVFTEAFLRKRGTCCESGCRHCPWDYRHGGGTGKSSDRAPT